MKSSKAGDKVVVNDFRKESVRELKKIKEAWPRLDYGLARVGRRRRSGTGSKHATLWNRLRCG